MIKIKFDKDKISIKGHSGYDVIGKDIVCASVSSIVITSINAIIRIDEKAISYKQDEGFIEINILWRGLSTALHKKTSPRLEF